MSILLRVFAFFCFAVSTFTVVPAQTATIREEQKTFRTYPFGDPNPVARMGNIYPYFRFEGYSATSVDKEWKIITLENPYVKVLIAPEIGGKILGAFEKSTGKPFIYFNKVVKFREIAMRGPWTSGGIEFNFGDIGHAPSTATPVDYTTRVNPDGSVSCIVGTIDLPSRTEWRVEIRLPKDKAYFEAHSFWYNPTALPTSLYHWMNAAADADSDLYFIYPGTAHIDHGGVSSPWPVNADGRDLSRYRNNAFGSSKSYHVLGTYTDFFGLGWKERNFGVIHWSDYAEKPGKKLWLWALSREGGIWTDLLTDTDLGNTQYVEFQSGLLFNQALPNSSYTPFKHLSFAPFSEERFTEAWFPFKDIGGVVQANSHALLNVEQRDSTLVFGVCPLEQVHEELVVTSGSKEIYRKKVAMKPMRSFVDSIAVPLNAAITVRLGSLVEYTATDGRERELARPRETNRAYDWNSAEGLAVDAAEQARQRDYGRALERFQASLSKDSLYNPALIGLAEMLYRRMEYDSALTCVSKALANDAYDPTANFLYGMLQRQRGRPYDAADGFSIAARSMQYRSSASTALAELALLQGQWEKAIGYANRALDYDRYNIGAMKARAVACRKLGQKENAVRAQKSILQIDPLTHFARMEGCLLEPGQKTRQALVSSIRAEFPVEVYLELAAYYYDIGSAEDALRALSFAPAHPIVLYWTAYLRNKMGNEQESERSLRDAANSSCRLVFPFRSETAEVLEWARSRSDSWQIRYYLGLIYWSKGRLGEARSTMEECGSRPTDAPFYIARGNLLKNTNDSLALLDYRRALAAGPDEWRVFTSLASFYNDHAQYNAALATLISGAKRFPENYVLQFEYARSLLLNQRYRECLAVLDTIRILPFEGVGYGRELHRQAAVLASSGAVRNGKYQEALGLLTKAREWPEHLGVGKPYDVDSRIEDYLEACCRMRMGDSLQARALFQSVVHATSSQKAHDAQYFLNLLALRRLDQGAEAAASLQAWSEAEPMNPVARWAMKAVPLGGQKSGASAGSADASTAGPWNPIPSDPSFPMVREIASLSLE